VGRTPPDDVGGAEAGGPPTAAASPPGPSEESRGTRRRTRVGGARSTIGETKRSLLQRAERERDRRESIRALFHLVEEDRGRGGGLLSGGLAYRMFLWLLPAALVGTSLLGLVADISDGSPSEAARSVGMGASFASTVNRAAAQAGQATPILLITGLALMLWASRGVLKAVRLVSSIAWGLSPAPLRSPIRSTLTAAGVLIMLSAYGLVVAPLYRGPLVSDVVATLLATSGIAAIATWAAINLPHPDGVGVLLMVPGAILFAVGVEALRLASSLYFASKLERLDDLYGALGFAAVFMAYLYLWARLIVLGLMINPAVWHARPSHESINGTG
jgi:uncharacterized BrkB/YihY/UPF0761 family membrane protein